MKRKTSLLTVVMIVYCLYVTSVAFATTFTYTYDTATPAGTDAPSIIDNRIREVKAALQERLNVEHVFDLTGTEVSHANTGQHTGINCTSITNTGNAVHTGTLSSTGNFAVNTDKFTVTAATGNTLVAGTLDVTGATEVTGVATLGDASLLKTSAAPTTDAMIANKKYVDDNEAATKYSINPMTGANDSTGTVTFPNGLIWKWGKTTRTATDTTVTFDTAFPNACFQAISCGGNNATFGNDVQSHTITAASFKIWCDNVAGSPMRWFAVGR